MKIITKFVSAVLCVVLICLAFVSCGKGSVTIEDMISSSRTENLLDNYSSIRVVTVYSVGNIAVVNYVDKDVAIVQNSSGMELYQNGSLKYMNTSGKLAGALYIDMEATKFDLQSNLFYSEGVAENLTSCEKKDGKWFVTSELSEEDTKALSSKKGYIYKEGEKLKISYELVGSTLAVLSKKEILVSKDGSERIFATVTASYNSDVPESAKELYAHATSKENLRTVTAIANPGTSDEKAYSIQVSKGDSVAFYAPNDYSSIYLDAECTKAVSELDKNSDVTVYLKKVPQNDKNDESSKN